MQMETRELQDQSSPFRREMLILARELEDFGNKIQEQLAQSDRALRQHIAPREDEEPDQEDNVH